MAAGKNRDIHPRPLVLKAINEAERRAGRDDVEFVRALRSSYFGQTQDRMTGRRSIAAGGTERFQHLKIFEDPRYAKNARLVAERTKQTKQLRILGGVFVKKLEFPDCVAIGIKGAKIGSKKKWWCSGTLIAPDAALTAGHCTKDMEEVYVGDDVTKSKLGKVIEVKEAIPRQDYSDQDNSNDLMVLILDEKVKGVAPRALASSSLIDNATDVRAVGFGTTDRSGEKGYGVKRMVDLPIVSNSCEGTFKELDDEIAYGCHKGLEFIAGKPLLEKDTCKGDSGGPIYVSDSNGSWYLAGVTSRGTSLATDTCGDGGVYVRVDKYRDWIKTVVTIRRAKFN